jgi:YD repeat-containing protein
MTPTGKKTKEHNYREYWIIWNFDFQIIGRALRRPARAAIHAVVLAAMVATSLPMEAIAAGLNEVLSSGTPSVKVGKQRYSAPLFSHPEPRIAERSGLDSLYQTPTPERHIRGYRPLVNPITLSWGSLVKDIYIPIDSNHVGWIVGVVISQPTGGTGTMSFQIGDSSGIPQVIVSANTPQHAYIKDPVGWPAEKKNLYSSTERQNAGSYLNADYSDISAYVYNAAIYWPQQASWSNGLRFRYAVYGGLGRPNGQLLGYVYIGESIPGDSLISPFCPPYEACLGTYKQASRTIEDPINVQNGGFGIAGPEVSFDTLAGKIAFQPTYASLVAQENGPLGYGWTHSLDTHLIFPSDPGGQAGIVLFKASSANLYRFNILQNGDFLAYPGVLASLEENSGPPISYTLTTKDNIIFQFDEDGKLLSIEDPKGNQKTYIYNQSGLPTQPYISLQKTVLKHLTTQTPYIGPYLLVIIGLTCLGALSTG